MNNQREGRESSSAHNKRNQNLRDTCQGNPKKSSPVGIHILANPRIVQLARQNTEIIPHPLRENPSWGSWWLCRGETLSSLGGYPICMLMQRRKSDLVIFRRLYGQNMHVCYNEIVAATLHSCVSERFEDTLVFLSCPLTTSVPPQPRLELKDQLVRGNKRKRIPSYSPTWSRQFNIW